MYNDQPLWEQQSNTKRISSKDEPIPRQIKEWGGFKSSDAHGSPLFRWATNERAKKSRGELNEWDIAEIKAACKGVKNKWFKLTEVHKQILLAFLDKPSQESYNSILELLKL